MRAFGHGSQKFIGSNKTEQGRQLNRRVEIELNNP
jgi:outer membrane protein OmpA-like peptidoglycan-associated protein